MDYFVPWIALVKIVPRFRVFLEYNLDLSYLAQPGPVCSLESYLEYGFASIWVIKC